MILSSRCKILPKGFKASGISAQIKKGGKKDLALFYSDCPCITSLMCTSNKIKAAPIEVSLRHFKKGPISAIIANSGNANCMTGAAGIKDAMAMTDMVAQALSLKKEEVLVSSTGIIGKPLPMAKIKSAIMHLVDCLSTKGLCSAAEAILTTDTFSKIVCLKFKVASKSVIISGIAKGAGMIAPRLSSAKAATMLVYLLTDARINKSALGQALQEAVNMSFNAITIDGCMSTNDMVVAMANGQAKNKCIRSGSKEAALFANVLKEVCLELAKLIVRDAEGATKFIEINVRGACSEEEAKRLALSVANSNLFKCAMFGKDPNWGRIVAALGSVPSSLRWDKLDISLNKRMLFHQGKPIACKDNKLLQRRFVDVDINLHMGQSQSCVYTSDLSYGYVRINADYN